jgi:ketosteroid isomerase-like protein
VAIFPGLGDEAKGKEAIGKMAIGICKSGTAKQVSSDARSVGGDYIMNIGRWEQAATGPDGKPVTVVIRTTELLHKGADGKWRYLVDHASIGLPPPPPTQKAAAQ